MEKLHTYQGWGGRLHEWRDNIRQRFSDWRENRSNNGDESVIELAKRNLREHAADRAAAYDPNDYSHITRPKDRSELIRVSAAVMGIEFSYAAETAFVSPTLLKIGVNHQQMTLVWALSPLVGFFLTPVLGSISDRCRLPLGRRRPFIILLSIGVLLGLLLVPNGELLGYAFGDPEPDALLTMAANVSTITVGRRLTTAAALGGNSAGIDPNMTMTFGEMPTQRIAEIPPHPWGIFFTILGTVLLDFDADACQSPARAYLLDVTVAEDHAKGLSTFTIMAGLGGFMGYSLGGINWDDTFIGVMLGGHVRAVFTLVTFIFIICVSATITSFREMPLWRIEAESANTNNAASNNGHEYIDIDSTAAAAAASQQDDPLAANDAVPLSLPTTKPRPAGAPIRPPPPVSYGAVDSVALHDDDDGSPPTAATASATAATLQQYLLSILHMPHSMRMICLTNLFCWMAHVCYSLYFTDFVGEAVFGGNPAALPGSPAQLLYEEGVRFGCWGMAMYSLSCACYSLVIERLIARFRAKTVYVGGLLFYCAGMTLMALTRARTSVIVFSWSAGVMYSTLFTMPYLLVAHYHSSGTFSVDAGGMPIADGTIVRGLGTDVAIVSSMVFLAQFILSLCMGTIVIWSGTTTAVVSVASCLSFCGAISATQIMYLDL